MLMGLGGDYTQAVVLFSTMVVLVANLTRAFTLFYIPEMGLWKMMGRSLGHAHMALPLVLAGMPTMVVAEELGPVAHIIVLVGDVFTLFGGFILYVCCKPFATLC
jgi:hypothetical protein